jgi:hypothetical protein
MVNLITKQAVTVALCAAAAYICENGGDVLQNKQVTKAVVCALATMCAGVVTYQTAEVAKKAIEEALPVFGKSLKVLGGTLKK